ncbi:MAG: hypothetical protein IPP77_06770 [Bacteroidetes bacterium]|nr:hypothetical protein [Bacteroidota bacterium]
MMKYLLLLLFPLQTFAQQWVFPGSQWTYHVYGWTGESLLYLNYEKDTVLSAQSCAKLRATLIKATHIGPDVYQIDTIYPESIYTYSQK